MADAVKPINVQADRLLEESLRQTEHLQLAAKQPTAAAPHLAAPAAPVDAAASQAAAAIRAKMAAMSTELAAKGPATQQAAAAAAASLQAQDAANSARLPSVPSPPSGGSGGSGLARGIQMLGSGPSGMAPPPRAPGPTPQPPPPPRPPPPRPIGPPTPQTPDPRLRHLPPPSWTRPAPAENSTAAQRQYQQVIDDIKAHNSWRPDPTNDFAVTNYNREAQWLNQTKASLEDQLNGWKAPYDASDSPATDAQTPLGTPAENPHTPRQPNIRNEDSGGGRRDWTPPCASLSRTPFTRSTEAGKPTSPTRTA